MGEKKGKGKKIFLKVLLGLLVLCIIAAVYFTHEWIVRGEQIIKLTMAKTLYTNQDIYFTVDVNHREDWNNSVDVPFEEVKVEAKLLDKDGKVVKNAVFSKENHIYKLSVPDIEEGNYTLKVKISSAYGKDTVTQKIYLSNGKAENITITMDKGIYKPGDLISFRALITEKEKDTPISEKVNISIYDGNDNRVYNENVETSEYGIIGGSFQLADEVNSGIYKLTIKTAAKEATKEFKVNPYVLPKYEVGISFDKDKYLVGETANVTVEAKYFFGEVVPNVQYAVYLDGNKIEEKQTDATGKFTFDYLIEEAKTYTFSVEAIDSSNYYVSAQKGFSAGTDIFEIELLPEYGDLAEGTRNTIYVQTKNADGSPIKTYLTVNTGNYTRQVATDDLGFGSFSMDISGANTTSTYDNSDNQILYSTSFKVTATDMAGNEVKKEITLPVKRRELLLTTDKVKYQEGEEINVKIFSQMAGEKTISVCKNDKLLKMITTDMDETSFTLDNVYGLIDIYVKKAGESNNSYYYKGNWYSTVVKKTVFVKPSKALSVDISTDKEEYQPGENITISIHTTDENNVETESALLVSMLDNAVLNLANNDITLDNIKLSLEGIMLSNELDAATLYACLMDDAKENALIGLLLKQNVGESKIKTENMPTYAGENSAETVSGILYIIIFLLLSIFLNMRFPTLRMIVLNLFTWGIFAVSIYAIVASILEYYYDFDESWLFYLIAILTLILDILESKRVMPHLISTTVSLILIGTIVLISLILTEVLWDVWDIDEGIFGILIAVFLLIFVVTIKIIEKIRTKRGKSPQSIKRKEGYIGKFIIAAICAVVVGFVLDKILFVGRGYEYSYSSYYAGSYRSWHTSIVLPSAILAVYGFNYLFNMRKKKEEGETTESDTGSTAGAVVASAIIIPIFLLVFYRLLFSFGSATIQTAVDTIDYSTKSNDGIHITPDPSYASSNFGRSSLLSSFGDIFQEDAVLDYGRNTSNNSLEKETEKVQETSEEAVRSVFLESMCFIPELIAQNGTANVDLKLADNITTWTIQTVGNTKDGRVGFGTLDTVKVFKDFFVDFELPNNLVKEDKVSIPVTIYNYTDNAQTVTLTIKEENWFKLDGLNQVTQAIEAQGVKMVYVPITVLETGTNKFRVEGRSTSYSDIIEKSVVVNPKGYKVEKVVSNGMLEDDISEDILLLDKMIEGTAKVKVKIYASLMAQAIEGMENIFKMPTGCFEQVSSSLYPNIVALKYMEDNNLIDEELKEKALYYISSGYQKLLSYEVPFESGGYSLYGHSPAETVLTAYGLMEITDLSEVYPVDQKVLDKMNAFLYGKQEPNGSFTITGYHYGGALSTNTLALNAYITWALSESNPEDSRLSKSVQYLKEHMDSVSDNYTLGLIANVLANVHDSDAEKICKRLIDSVQIDGKSAYITSNAYDYYGCRYDYQTIQTVALTSMALSKTRAYHETNKQLINYLIEKKDYYGTWYNTQATILCLKAFNEANEKNKLDNQTIKVAINQDSKDITINDNPLDFYEVTFENIEKENKLSIDMEGGNAYYEVVEEYYRPYDLVNLASGDIEVTVNSNTTLKVNGILNASIRMVNRGQNSISNGMVTISIPQGFVVEEDSLMKLTSQGTIEKYEMNYRSINLYLRDFEVGQIIDTPVQFRASYPVDITGLSVRVYDYYNPTVEGMTKPIHITVTK